MVTKAEGKKEDLARAAHRAWSGWMEHLFKNSVHNRDGSVTIPRTLVDRWKRQMRTPYEDLPEREKKSDRVEADRYIEAIDGPAEDPVGRKDTIESGT